MDKEEKLKEEKISKNKKKYNCSTKTKTAITAMIADLEIEIFEKKIRLAVLKEIRAKYA